LFVQALKADVSNYKLLDSRGAACFKLGQHREALADAEKQTELQPTAAQGYKRAANVYQVQKMWATAIKVLEAACRRCSEDKQVSALWCWVMSLGEHSFLRWRLLWSA
jgi:tetratricopeptide (TPR) repeat protein